MIHAGTVQRRSGSGSKWEGVRCTCGWSAKSNGTRRSTFEAMWRAHIRALGGKPEVDVMQWTERHGGVGEDERLPYPTAAYPTAVRGPQPLRRGDPRNDSHRVVAAVEVAGSFGSNLGIDKVWVLDQVVRRLTGCPIDPQSGEAGESDEYKMFVAFYGDWDVGRRP